MKQVYDIGFVRLYLSDMELRDAQLKTIFEMLKVLIDSMEETKGYDFSHNEVSCKSNVKGRPEYLNDAYDKLVDDNFKSDYPK